MYDLWLRWKHRRRLNVIGWLVVASAVCFVQVLGAMYASAITGWEPNGGGMLLLYTLFVVGMMLGVCAGVFWGDCDGPFKRSEHE